MRASARLEDSNEKDNVTPGAIIPAIELLAELLLELEHPGEALKKFEASLVRTPNRRNVFIMQRRWRRGVPVTNPKQASMSSSTSNCLHSPNRTNENVIFQDGM